jgi:hypothetical protein
MATDYGNLLTKAWGTARDNSAELRNRGDALDSLREVLTRGSDALIELPKVSGDHATAQIFYDAKVQRRGELGQITSAAHTAPAGSDEPTVTRDQVVGRKSKLDKTLDS